MNLNQRSFVKSISDTNKLLIRKIQLPSVRLPNIAKTHMLPFRTSKMQLLSRSVQMLHLGLRQALVPPNLKWIRFLFSVKTKNARMWNKITAVTKFCSVAYSGPGFAVSLKSFLCLTEPSRLNKFSFNFLVSEG